MFDDKIINITRWTRDTYTTLKLDSRILACVSFTNHKHYSNYTVFLGLNNILGFNVKNKTREMPTKHIKQTLKM